MDKPPECRRMKTRRAFSLARFWAIVVKEFIQMRRDRVTFAMMIGIPLIQLCSLALPSMPIPSICPPPWCWPIDGPHGPHAAARDQNSSYFDFVTPDEDRSGRPTWRSPRGEVQFVVNIPENFSRDLLRGDRPARAGRGRRHRPGRHEQRPRLPAGLLDTAPCKTTSKARWPFWRAAPAPSICAFTPSTTRKRSRNTTSCPA